MSAVKGGEARGAEVASTAKARELGDMMCANGWHPWRQLEIPKIAMLDGALDGRMIVYLKCNRCDREIELGLDVLESGIETIELLEKEPGAG